MKKNTSSTDSRTVTVYVPALNSEKTIGSCLKNIMNLKNVKEVFVIDGGSTDNTVKIARSFAGSLNVKVLFQPEKGLANARNIAVKRCKTSFLAGIDSDCIPERDWLDLSLAHFINKNVAGVCGRLIETNGSRLADRWRAFHLKQDWGNFFLENPPFLYGSNSIFRAQALREVDGYDEKYKTNYEDVDVSGRLKKKGYTLVYEPAAVCRHLREDTLFSAIRTARNWSFYSYTAPDTLFNLIKRLFICNPHLALRFLFDEFRKGRFYLMPITLLSFFFNQYYDAGYYLGNRLGYG